MRSGANAQSIEIEVRDWEAGGYAQSYRQTVGGWWDDLEPRLLVRAIGAKAGCRVLDAGAGVGRITSALVRAGCEVVAVDFSFRSLRFLRLRSGFRSRRVLPVTATLADPLPVCDASMDAVASCQVVQHIPTRENRVRAWQHIRAAVRPGAYLAALVYKTWPGEADDGVFEGGIRYHRYTPVDLAAELREGGWEPVRLSAYYRRNWSSRLPPLLPTLLEVAAATLHVADNDAHYLLVIARPRPN
jgi:SAM-dependent methyltransferase